MGQKLTLCYKQTRQLREETDRDVNIGGCTVQHIQESKLM